MPRPRIHENDTERKRQWRKNRPTKEQKAALDRLYRFKIENQNYQPTEQTIAGRIARRKEATSNRPFIAIDGEGETRNAIHYYTMLSSSEGHTIENWKFGLSTVACFDFLLQYAGKGILVGFFTSYDINMILKDMDYDSLVELYEKGVCWWNGYFVEWFTGKNFCLTKEGKSIVWFDVFGFFQKSFIRTLADWKIEAPKEVIEGKAARQTFSQKQRLEIRKYNLIECALLVELMNKLRIAARDAGCEPKRWHGAGAIANTVLKKYRVDSHNPEVSPEIEEVLLSGYYGGRNQVLRMGEIANGFSHDINSAYPFALKQLPSSNGTWSYTKKFDRAKTWSNWHLKWKLPKTEVVTPFPYRSKGNIYFPLEGEGWYWLPETQTALNHWDNHIKVIEGWFFEPASDDKPFSFINDLYAKRREFIRDDNDAQIVIKLAINALYGKTAQSIGFQGQRPPFQNFFWAGYTTSLTRSMVLDLAMRNSGSVISFATDGVLASEKLTEHNLTKQLGSWTVDPVENLFVLQPGVYSFDDAEHKTKIKSRGFSYRSVNYEELRKVWRSEGVIGSYQYKETRFLGLGATHRSKLRGWRTWIEQEREINFAPTSGHTSLELASEVRVYPDKRISKAISEAYTKKSEWLSDEFKSDLEQ